MLRYYEIVSVMNDFFSNISLLRYYGIVSAVNENFVEYIVASLQDCFSLEA